MWKTRPGRALMLRVYKNNQITELFVQRTMIRPEHRTLNLSVPLIKSSQEIFRLLELC